MGAFLGLPFSPKTTGGGEVEPEFDDARGGDCFSEGCFVSFLLRSEGFAGEIRDGSDDDGGGGGGGRLPSPA